MGNESDMVGTTRLVVHARPDAALASQPEIDFVTAVKQRAELDGDARRDDDVKPRRRRRRRRFGPVGAIVVLVIVAGLAVLSRPEGRQWIGMTPSVETPAPTVVADEPALSEAEIPGAGLAHPSATVTAPPSEPDAPLIVWQPGGFRESETGSTVRYLLPPGTPPVPNQKPALDDPSI